MTAFEDCGLAIPAVASGDRSALAVAAEVDVARLVETYAALLFRVAHAILRSRPEAEDVVQDCFVRVLERRTKLNEVHDMRVWLVRITWNLALDRRRRKRPDQMDEAFSRTLAGANLPVDQALADAARMTAVLGEIERLPSRERHVLLLSAIDELNTVEIAAVLGRSESATRALLFRARTRLKERLAKGGHR